MSLTQAQILNNVLFSLLLFSGQHVMRIERMHSLSGCEKDSQGATKRSQRFESAPLGEDYVHTYRIQLPLTVMTESSAEVMKVGLYRFSRPAWRRENGFIVITREAR